MSHKKENTKTAQSTVLPDSFERLLRDPTLSLSQMTKAQQQLSKIEAELAADALRQGYSLNYQNLWREAALRNQQMLYNILPAHVGVRMAQGDTLIADGYADVSVLFADITNFTLLSSDLTPRAVVELLDDFFTTLDDLCEKHDLEKIKTIGDAYMAAGGLEPRTEDNVGNGDGNHTERVLAMAQDILAYSRAHAPVMNQPFAVHIGIGTGPVVAGVIGRKKITYDLWGDTVNIAARMCAEAAPMGIAVDELSYLSLLNLKATTSAQVERVEIKGKGSMQVFKLVV